MWKERANRFIIYQSYQIISSKRHSLICQIWKWEMCRKVLMIDEIFFFAFFYVPEDFKTNGIEHSFNCPRYKIFQITNFFMHKSSNQLLSTAEYLCSPRRFNSGELTRESAWKVEIREKKFLGKWDILTILLFFKDYWNVTIFLENWQLLEKWRNSKRWF